jgi:hypothetical protein
MGINRNAYRVVVGRPEEKRRLGGHGHRWKDNVKIDIEEIGWVEMIWFRLGQWQVFVNAVMNVRFP